MKKIFSILCGLMAIAIAITACTNEELPVSEGQTPAAPGEKVSVKAYAPGDDNAVSRIVFTPNEGDAPTVPCHGVWKKAFLLSVVRKSRLSRRIQGAILYRYIAYRRFRRLLCVLSGNCFCRLAY